MRRRRIALRHGVRGKRHATGDVMGRAMAQVIAGNPTANPLRDVRSRWEPGHFGPSWFLPFVGAYYRAFDFMD